MTSSFQSIGLNPTLLKVVEQLYFKQPTEIQQQAIPEIINKKSLIGQSQTGSGKTHAFLLPLFHGLDEHVEEVQYVITAPTRELAMQIHEEAKTIISLAGKSESWSTRLVVGGMDRERMMKQLERKPQIVIGTPGRILDMVKSGAMSIYHAKAFVIDEADLMVEMNFIETIDELLVRSRKDIQMLVFSATIPAPLEVFFRKYLRNPVHIHIQNGVAPEQIEHRLIAKKHHDTAEQISRIAKIIQPYVALIFVNSKETADELSGKLKGYGLRAGVLHGGLSARERTRMVKAINDLKFEYIVATDLASRGIDIKGASHVINAEMPKELDFYIHRVGRTARAGLEGTAISFYTEEDEALIAQLEKRGISFLYTDIRQGAFVESKHYNKRNLRKNVTTDLDKEAWKKVRKPKKVKPGYKKKMKQEQERVKRQLKKQRYTKR